MENLADSLLILITLIIMALKIRWYISFMDALQNYRDRRLREKQIDWLWRCYSVNQVEVLDRIWYKQMMDEYYY